MRMSKENSSVLSLRLSGATILGIMLLVAGCGKREPAEMPVTESQAMLVSQITGGQISPHSPIRVRFATPVISGDKVGSAPQEVFRFSPAIAGEAEWEDVQTLVFKPDSPLPLRQKYTGDVNISALMPEETVKRIPVSFTVAGREVAAVTYDFSMANGDPNVLVLEGEADFTVETAIEDVRKGITFTLDGKSVDLEWNAVSGGKTFRYRSDPLKRTGKDSGGQLRFDRSALSISEEFRKEIVLPSNAEMKLLEILKKRDGNRTLLIARFSDLIDTQSSLSGLITVEPALNIRLTAAGREVHISGGFEYGETYRIRAQRGIRSKWGTVTRETVTRDVTIEDMKPQIRFISDGVYLPPANRGRLRFQTVNVRTVKLNIKKVFESNLGQFLQSERLSSLRTRSQSFDSYYMDRVGVDVVDDTLMLGDARNEWITNELDMTALFDEDTRGLFLVSMTFNDGDVLFGTLDSETEEERRERRYNYYYGPNYYSDPYSPGYYYQHGRIYKPVILSDIGLLHRRPETAIMYLPPISGPVNRPAV